MDEREKLLQALEDTYREKIVEMIRQIEDAKFLIQIHTILKKHIEKRGG